jgi:hydroxycarboxylate dehydrogenase B
MRPFGQPREAATGGAVPIISAAQLTDFADEVLRAAGLPGDEAAVVSRSLVASDLCGHDSHGVLRLPSYVEKLAKGEAVPRARFTIVREGPTLLMADGNWGFGPVQAQRLTDRVAEKAAIAGMAVGTLFRVTHVGRLGEYCERAAASGLVSLIMANAHSSRRVAPPGGKTSRIGTNPIAFGVPHRDGVLLLDFSTAAAAEGKIRQRKVAGLPCPDGWLIDNQGQPSNDPQALYTSPPGAILPMGGAQAYKGFGLALMIEIFAGALSGGMCIREKPRAPLGNCVFMLLLNPSLLGGLEHFQREVADLMVHMRTCPLAHGADEILLPGDPERRTRAQRRREGIPVEERNWAALVELAERLDVLPPEFAAEPAFAGVPVGA